MQNYFYSLLCGLFFLCGFSASAAPIGGAIPTTDIPIDDTAPSSAAAATPPISFKTKEEGIKAAAEYAAKDEDSKAVETVLKLIEKFPKDAQSILAPAGELEATEDLKLQSNEIRAKRCIASIHMSMAQSLLWEGKLAACMSSYLHAEDLDPKNSMIYFREGVDLTSTRDPACSAMALNKFAKAKALGLEDFTLPIMTGLAQVQAGDDGGLELLRKAAADIPPGDDTKALAEDVKARIIKTEAAQKKRQEATNPPEKRHYTIESGTMAVVVTVDEKKNLIKFAILGGHDPDKGAQDGVDDGIIEMPKTDFAEQDKSVNIYRPKQ